MNSQSKSFYFQKAKSEDSQEILEILEENEFKGQISLTYTRRPNAYHSFQQEGQDVELIICRDNKSQRIIGFGAGVVKEAYVDGEKRRICYLFGLRMRKEYRKRARVVHRAYEFLREIFEKKEVDFYISTILAENTYAQQLLEKKRKFMPTYEYIDDYQVYNIKTGLKYKKDSNLKLRLQQATKEDIPKIIDFINQCGKKYQFYDVLEENDLLTGKLANLNYNDFYMLMNQQNNELLACGACWEQSSYKQYIVEGYSGLYKLMLPISMLFPLFGYPSLPKVGSRLDFFILSFWAIKDNDPDIFRSFINLIANQITDYPYFSIGLSATNPLIEILKEKPHFLYQSKVYFVNWDKENRLKEELKQDLPLYLECGRL